MHEWIFAIALMWIAGLVGALALFALRTRRLMERTLAVDTLALVFVAALALIGIHRGVAGYLDVALVIAMLGFVQTVATARYAEMRRRDG